MFDLVMQKDLESKEDAFCKCPSDESVMSDCRCQKDNWSVHKKQMCMVSLVMRGGKYKYKLKRRQSSFQVTASEIGTFICFFISLQ